MKTAYVVLGMHRSGTSSVAGSLAILGAKPPTTLMEPKEENPKGFWESEKIMVLNDQIFRSAGSSWQDWGPLDPSAVSGPQGQEFAAAARSLVEAEFGEADVIVLKDPRICRLYPFWRAVLLDMGFSPIIVSPVRAPSEVVASLTARNAMSPRHAMRLWLSHVLEAEDTSRGDRRHILLWPDFISSWREHMGRIAALGGPDFPIEAVAHEVDDFLSDDLHRHRAVLFDESLPPLVLGAIRALDQLARGAEPDAAMAKLDDIRREFAAARELFYDGPF